MKNRSRFRKLILVLSWCAFIISSFACSDSKHGLGRDIIGKWITEEPRYADRFIEISQDRLILGTGDNLRSIYAIRGIEPSGQDKNRVYVINCEAYDGSEFHFEFRVETKGNVLSLMVKNQDKTVWHKTHE